jgi:hypothetical protein
LVGALTTYIRSFSSIVKSPTPVASSSSSILISPTCGRFSAANSFCPSFL